MSANREASDLRGWGVVVTLALASLGGLLAISSKFSQVARPGEALLWSEGTAGRVPARLWEDPLPIAVKERNRLRDADEDGSGVAPYDTFVNLLRSKASSGRVLIMPAFVSGSQRADASDNRIGDRIALASALAEEGYVPEATDFIRWFTISGGESLAAPTVHATKVEAFTQFLLRLASDDSADRVRLDPPALQIPIAHAEAPVRAMSDEERDLLLGAVIPYEWFRAGPDAASAPNADERPASTLVMWIRSDRISARSWVPALELMLEQFFHGESELLENVSIAAVGPSSSGALRQMLGVDLDDRLELVPADERDGAPVGRFAMRGAHDHASARVAEVLHQRTVFLAESVTIAGEQLRDDLARGASASSARFRLAQVAAAALDPAFAREADVDPAELDPSRARDVPSWRLLDGPRVVRTIGSDAALLDAIATELDLRGIRPADPEWTGFVALVNPWDSLYGRSLPRTLIGTGEGAWREDRLLRAHYLSGLDGTGESPRVEQPDEAEESGPLGMTRLFRSGPRYERLPVGKAQLDYVERVVEDLARQERALRSGPSDRIAAIGVLGGSIHDKVVLLEALAHRFPDAHFFTTDHHALLEIAVQRSSLRELLVASHFDLRLGTDQAMTPPFRSNYQTALFFAARRYLKNPPAMTSGLHPNVRACRVFEIGNGETIALSMPVEAQAKDAPAVGTRNAADAAAEFDAVFPPSTLAARPWREAVRISGGVALAGLAFFALISLVRQTWLPNDYVRARSRSEFGQMLAFGLPRWIFVVLVPIGLWTFVELVFAGMRGEEPVALVSGTSAWPGIVLRIVVVLGVAGLIYADRRARLGQLDLIERDFGLDRDRQGDSGFAARARAGAQPVIEVVTRVSRRFVRRAEPVPAIGAARVEQSRSVTARAASEDAGDAGDRESETVTWTEDRITSTRVAVERPASDQGMGPSIALGTTASSGVDASPRAGTADETGGEVAGVDQVSHQHASSGRPGWWNVLGWQGEEIDGRLHVESLWSEFRTKCASPARVVRVSLMLVVLALLVAGVGIALGAPDVSIRGAWSRALFVASWSAAIIAIMVLVLCVWDHSRLIGRFVMLLTEQRSTWPDTTPDDDADLRGMPGEARAECLDTRLVARVTQLSGGAVEMPFVLLVAIIIADAWNPDGWLLSPAILTAILLSGAIALVAVQWTRTVGRGARDRSIARLEALRSGVDSDSDEAHALDVALVRVQSIREGAFGGVARSPMLRAVLIPFGGIGAYQLLEALAMSMR